MPAVAPLKVSYTDSIVTNVWGDGKNLTPSIAYSHNPATDIDAVKRAAKGTKRAREKAAVSVANLKKALIKYNIDQKRVRYIVPTKKGAMYCPETPEIYTDFIKTYQSKTVFTTDTWVIRDAGTAYIKDGISVVIAANVLNDITLPPVNHHAFSVNDHSLHGHSKGKWHALRDLDNDLDSTLALLQLIDNVPKQTIETWFNRNYLYDTYNKSAKVVTDAMTNLLFGKSTRWEMHHNDCLEAFYKEFPDKFEEIEMPKAKKVKRGKAVVHGKI